MTTLPQTTPIRLPRPAGSTALAYPAAPLAVSPAASGGFSMTGNDVWRVIRANLWLIILMLIAAGAAGYGANTYLEKNHSIYTAHALIQIQPIMVEDPLKNVARPYVDNASLVIAQRTQATLLKNESLFSSVLSDENSRIRNTDWYQKLGGDHNAMMQSLKSDFVVAPEQDSALIEVSMSCANKADTTVIIEEIVDHHLLDQFALNQAKQAERSAMLNQARTKYELDLQEAKRQAREDEADLNMNGVGVSGRVSTLDATISDEVKQEERLKGESAQATAEYNRLVDEQSKGIDPPEIEEAVASDPAVSRAKSDVDAADLSLGEMSVTFGPNNPNIQKAQKQHDFYQDHYDQIREERLGTLRNDYLAKLRNQSEGTKQALDATTERVNELKNEMGLMSNKMAEDLSARDQAQTAQDLLTQTNHELTIIEQIQAEREQLTGVSWASHPQLPESRSFPRLSACMGLALALGLVMSLGIAFLRELTDTTVRSPRDIQRVGQMTLLGMVPHEADDPQSAGARLPLVIFEAPHSILAEQLRQVRTRLQHAASLDTTRSILVTSPSPGDGKSTIAVNLAAGLALNGRRILLVDANFRRPDIHRIFDVGNEVGFSDVLNDLGKFEQAVVETQVPNLSILASGPKPANPTELLESQLLLDFIERVLEEYDHVIFDSGPMLFVSESVALAPRVDGVVTVVKARTNTRGVLQRMRDGLRQVKAEHLGVVLNAVRSQGGGYYGRNIKTYYEYQNAGA